MKHLVFTIKMKQILKVLILCLGISAFGQSIDYNIKKGAVIEGYDVVAYFSNSAIRGSDEFKTTYKGGTFKFSNEENLLKFKENPEKYAPQYGGYCAYAIALKGKKVKINPKTFEIRNGKLYLFYNAFGTNTLEKWESEQPDELVKQADKNWSML